VRKEAPAADQGSEQHTSDLGGCCNCRTGVSQDADETARLFLCAAKARARGNRRAVARARERIDWKRLEAVLSMCGGCTRRPNTSRCTGRQKPECGSHEEQEKARSNIKSRFPNFYAAQIIRRHARRADFDRTDSRSGIGEGSRTKENHTLVGTATGRVSKELHEAVLWRAPLMGQRPFYGH
jgi:hypothetical protein